MTTDPTPTPTPLRTTLSGDALKTERLTLGLSQRQLAERLSVSTQTISDWETGRTTPAHPGMLRLAMDQLGLTTSTSCQTRVPAQD